MIWARYNKIWLNRLPSLSLHGLWIVFFPAHCKACGESPDSQMATYCEILPLLTWETEAQRRNRVSARTILGVDLQLVIATMVTSVVSSHLSWKQAQGSELTQNHQAENRSQEIIWSQASHVCAYEVCKTECFYWCSGEGMYVWRSEDNFPESFFSFNHRGPRHGTQAERQA